MGNYLGKYKDKNYFKKRSRTPKVKKQQQEYYIKNKNKIDERSKKWDKKYPDKKRERNRKSNFLSRHMNRKRYDSYKMWPFETCKFCGNRIIPAYNVSDEIWEKVIGKEICICLSCFDREAQKKELEYKIINTFFIFWFNK